MSPKRSYASPDEVLVLALSRQHDALRALVNSKNCHKTTVWEALCKARDLPDPTPTVEALKAVASPFEYKEHSDTLSSIEKQQLFDHVDVARQSLVVVQHYVPMCRALFSELKTNTASTMKVVNVKKLVTLQEAALSFTEVMRDFLRPPQIDAFILWAKAMPEEATKAIEEKVFPEPFLHAIRNLSGQEDLFSPSVKEALSNLPEKEEMINLTLCAIGNENPAPISDEKGLQEGFAKMLTGNGISEEVHDRIEFLTKMHGGTWSGDDPDSVSFEFPYVIDAIKCVAQMREEKLPLSSFISIFNTQTDNMDFVCSFCGAIGASSVDREKQMEKWRDLSNHMDMRNIGNFINVPKDGNKDDLKPECLHCHDGAVPEEKLTKVFLRSFELAKTLNVKWGTAMYLLDARQQKDWTRAKEDEIIRMDRAGEVMPPLSNNE